MLPACRRLLERQPTCGPLWWLSATVLTSGDPEMEAERCGELLLDDPTGRRIHELAEDPSRRLVRRGGIGEVASADAVVVPVSALGGDAMLVDSGMRSLVEAARACEVALWIESGVGRLLPRALWQALVTRVDTGRFEPGSHWLVESLDGVELVIGPDGTTPVGNLPAAASVACPEPPELTGGW